MANNELFKTIETQGRLITELGSQLQEMSMLTGRLVDYLEPHEEEHYEECLASDIDVSDHIMNPIKELKVILKTIIK
tara:strand:+ start:1329 stop:1559 length:231 start_codon:yes stop_codon:yes gene_type:complete